MMSSRCACMHAWIGCIHRTEKGFEAWAYFHLHSIWFMLVPHAICRSDLQHQSSHGCWNQCSTPLHPIHCRQIVLSCTIVLNICVADGFDLPISTVSKIYSTLWIFNLPTFACWRIMNSPSSFFYIISFNGCIVRGPIQRKPRQWLILPDAR